MTGYRHVAALGSSFAAGPGIEPVADRAARRSTRNYPGLLATALGARLTDLTVSGATTATMLETSQRTLRKRFPPQLDGLPADADLITITAGGNDLGYIGSMMNLATSGWLRGRRPTRPLGRWLGRGGCPIVTAAECEAATTGLARVVEAARRRAPEARIVLVDYLTVVGDDAVPGPGLPLSDAEIDGYRAIAGQLTDVFAAASDRSSADLVRASELSRGHGIGSAEPWVSGFRISMRPTPFHPNLAGMQAVADEVLALIGAPRDRQPE